MEIALQCVINALQGHLFPKFGKAGDAEFGDPARDDAAEMCKVRSDVEREAVERHPALHAHA